MNSLLAFTPTLAAISGDNVIQAVIWIIIVGVVYGLLLWLIDYVGLPEPFNKGAKVVLVIAAVLLLINAILMIAGHPFIKW